MDRSILESFLPAFMIVFCGIVFLWDRSQQKNSGKLPITRTGIYKEINFVKRIFESLFSVSILVTVIYSFFPDYYTIFVPIDFLDHPIINTVGVLILKISLAWIVIALLFFNKSVFMMQAKNNEATYSRLILYASRHLLSGMLVMFLGFFITISSGVALLISCIGLIFYERLLRIQTIR